ncbi:MAG: TonB-dependent receptor, partial [Bacteroidota bacterium]|nr:TonB-dependent receptor [Bacteroidota bacterium]
LPMDERSDDTRLFSVDYSIKQVAENIPSIKIKYYNSDVKHKMDNVWRAFSDTVVAVSDIHANNQGGRAELQWTKKDETVFVGADYEAVFKDGDRVKNMILQPGLPVRTENLWSNATIQNLGLFFSYENKALDFDWIVSARIDGNIGDSDDVIIKNPFGTVIYEYGADSINSDYLNFSASAGVSKEFSKELLAKLNIGRGVRSPDMVERFITLLPVGYDKFDYLGNPSLKPEINNQLELSLVYDNEFYGKVSLTGFYSFVENYITGNILPPSQQRPLTKDVLGVKQFYNADKAFLHGFEFRYLSKKYYRCSVDISAAYTNGIIDITEVYDIEDGVAVRVREVENDAIPEIAPFEINIKLRYYNDEIGLSGFVSYRVATEQNHLSEAYFENATPGFSVVDAKIVYRYNKKLSFSGGVKNLFDVAYYEHLNRNIIGSKNDFYERGRSFFMNLKITL